MSKKKKSFDVLTLVVLILGVITFAIMFLKAVYVDIPSPLEDIEYTGLQMAFGYKDGNTQIFEFNILAALMYIVPLLSSILVVIASSGIKKVIYLVCGLFFVGSAVLLGLTKEIVELPLSSILTYELTVFTIIGIVTASLAALVSFILVVKD